ncbi:MAG: DUF4859 domain-containing protein [Bacteroidales bacterium]|jgi:hypothetical protein|nr:DUF4859 domain-containing protein [Bacteroidales bacterium]
MKHKILALYLFSVCLTTAFFTACEDELASVKHEYTEEEQRYRDSIEAARAGVKADFILTEDIELTYGNWSSVNVPLDLDVICEKLGYAGEDAFKAGFGAFDGEVRLLAVNPATGADFSDHVVDEAGVQEGFVFSPFGEPGATWDWPASDSEQLYTMWVVYNTNNVEFTVGMRTGVMASGETYKVILLLKKGDYRLALIYNISIVEPETDDPNAYVADETIVKDVMLVSPNIESNASVVTSIDGALLADKLGYADAGALSAALGNLEWNTQVNNQVTFFGVDASTGIDYTGSYTAGMGYWFTATGDICAYSDENATLYANLDPATLQLTVGQKGGKVNAGDTYQLIIMFANADNYRVAIELNVTTIEDQAPAGNPYELSLTQTVVHKITTGWEQDFIDVTGVMRDAFKMTAAQINAAIASNTMTFYAVDPDNSQKPSTSGGVDYPGHWFNADGTVATDWQDGEIFIQIQTSPDNIRFMLLNQPSNITSPTTITVKQVAELNGGKVNFTFNVVLVSGDITPHEADYAATVEILKNDTYSTTAFDITSVIAAAFQKSPNEIAAAISDRTLEFYALDGNDGQKASTANFPGHWFDANGNVTGWGETAVLFAEMGVADDKVTLNIGNYPGCALTAVTFRQVAKLNGGQVNLTFTVDLRTEP